jgi:hypothetical protein
MPTNLAARRTSARRLRSEMNDILQSEDVTALLLWTAAGLALFLVLVILGLQPDGAQDWIMLG